jgi:hypothetical protein
VRDVDVLLGVSIHQDDSLTHSQLTLSLVFVPVSFVRGRRHFLVDLSDLGAGMAGRKLGLRKRWSGSRPDVDRDEERGKTRTEKKREVLTERRMIDSSRLLTTE